jgi:hypothetical protein
MYRISWRIFVDFWSPDQQDFAVSRLGLRRCWLVRRAPRYLGNARGKVKTNRYHGNCPVYKKMLLSAFEMGLSSKCRLISIELNNHINPLVKDICRDTTKTQFTPPAQFCFNGLSKPRPALPVTSLQPTWWIPLVKWLNTYYTITPVCNMHTEALSYV